jgi:simple sugar transport system substrate-binding protein
VQSFSFHCRHRLLRSPWMRVTAAAVVTMLMLAACGSSGHTSSESTETSEPSILVLGGPLSIQTQDSVKLGADAAAKALGARYEYLTTPSLSNFVADYTALINEAIARHPSAMVIGNFVPSAFDPLIRKAVADGIPVVVIDSGISTWQSDGAIGWVGWSPDTVGTDAVQRMISAGARDLLCVDQTTNPFVEQVCTTAKMTMKSAGGTYYQLNVPVDDLTNPSALTLDIQGYLASHPRIDGVFTAGGGFGVVAATAVTNLGKTGQIKVGGNEVNTSTLTAIKSGSIAFEIADEPYVEGYDSLQIAAQYARYKMMPSSATVTNGVIVESDNVNEYTTIDSKYPGVVG